MTPTAPPAITALIADDEPLLREVMQRLLAAQWPELQVVAQARNGVDALVQFEALRPTVCFLDVHMPGLTGIEVAQRIGRRAHVVFVTAFDQYALQAFEQGVLDYLVKPVQAARLAHTLARLRERVQAERPAVNTEDLLAQLAAHFRATATPAATPSVSLSAPAPDPSEASPAGASAPPPLRWIRAAIGASVRLIPVDDIDYLKADTKYTLVAWRGDGGVPGEALITTPLKTLLAQLDPAQFQQVHRAVVVNLQAVSHVTRGPNETADLYFRHRPDVLPVSRTFLHLFKAA